MRILVVVDYQNDFVDGALGSADAASIEDAVVSRIDSYLSSGDPVVLTMDTHGPGYLGILEGRILPVEHCIRGTPGWELHGRVASMASRCTVLEKGTFGCVDLYGILREYDEIELCGVATNVCVMANAVIARTANPEARITVRADCVASYDAVLGQKALDVMESLQVEVIR